MEDKNIKIKHTPAMTSKILNKDQSGKAFDKSFHYCSMISKQNYLEKGTRSDIYMAT